MLTSKVFALSLLFVSVLASAKVQFDLRAAVKNSVLYGNRDITVKFQIDEHETLEVYHDNTLKIVAELLSERDDAATICFTIYDHDTTIIAPVLIPNYVSPATLSLGSSKGESFTLVVNAQKV